MKFLRSNVHAWNDFFKLTQVHNHKVRKCQWLIIWVKKSVVTHHKKNIIKKIKQCNKILRN